MNLSQHLCYVSWTSSYKFSPCDDQVNFTLVRKREFQVGSSSVCNALLFMTAIVAGRRTTWRINTTIYLVRRERE